jgi:predicted XRE-type DNA-binding protein
MSSRTTTGSIFRDLGMPEAVAQDLIVRSRLMRTIQHRIREGGLSHLQATAILGVDQSCVANLMAGRLSLFSADRLMEITARMGLSADADVASLMSPTE